MGLEPRILSALTGLGYEEPTPIQREAIPPLRAGRDLLGQAATGTGKTAAFALPLLEQLVPGSPAPSSLILVPTRELAIQVAEAVYRYGRDLGVRVLPIYGGQSFAQQLRVLRRGVDVVVATPGRALDHMRRGTLPLDELRLVVLDEADEMLDMGFAEDIEAILVATPTERQTVLFSATLPPRIAGIAQRHLREPVQIKIAGERVAAGQAPRVQQVAYLVPRAYKSAALTRVLDLETPAAAIVFCRTRLEVDEVSEALNARGYRAEALHGGMTQEQRDRVMRKFRGGNTDLLVATDVAARGLDIEQLTHVVNYDVPSSPEAYVHRIGRVGRAGREGVAITLAEPRQQRLLNSIEQLTRQRIEVASVPTVADLRLHRLELSRASLREVLGAGDLDRYRVVVDALAGEFDLMDIALAAVKLAHQTAGMEATEGEEIPQLSTGARKQTGGATRRGEQAHGEKMRGKPRGDKPRGDKSRGDKPRGDKPRGDKVRGEKVRGEKVRGEKVRGEKVRGEKVRGEKVRGEKVRGEKAWGEKAWGDEHRGERPRNRKVQGEMAPGGKARGEEPRTGRSRNGQGQGDEWWRIRRKPSAVKAARNGKAPRVSKRAG